mmetsp:Transcript_25309/g.31185  ORF Transcript_25309/g.31185 Transcript_25309/m.31185 type:complete len:509 (-) Transcript_25309:243-1769(-)
MSVGRYPSRLPHHVNVVLTVLISVSLLQDGALSFVVSPRSLTAGTNTNPSPSCNVCTNKCLSGGFDRCRSVNVDVNVDVDANVSSTSLRMVSSKEEDLEKTIQIIMAQKQNAAAVSRATKNTNTVTSTGSQTVTIMDSVEKVLSYLTTCFPLFVLSSAILAIKKPATLAWVNSRPSLIPMMLAAVMTFMGMTLQTKDFKAILNPTISTSTSTETSVSTLTSTSTTETSTTATISAIPVGVLCQYLIMPLTAYAIGSKLLLPINSAAFLGLILVGCCPGGTASNLVALIAKADVALSVILTTASTILASILTPLLVKTLTYSTSSSASNIAVSGIALCKATTQVILGPICLGMTIRKALPKVANTMAKIAPFAGVILVSLLCGGVVAQNASLFLPGGGATGVVGSSIVKNILISVLSLHTVGFAMGYLLPRKLFKLSETTARTISIETGMQNSALAVVLAQSVIATSASQSQGLLSLAMLPGAMSATAHSCLGSILAVYWRFIDDRKKK